MKNHFAPLRRSIPRIAMACLVLLLGMSSLPANAAPVPASIVPIELEVFDLNPGSSGSDITAFVTSGGLAYFTAVNAENGQELWRSDGSAAGTFLLADIWPGPASSAPKDLKDFNGTLLFTAESPTTGRELWQTQGTPETTHLVRDIVPGYLGSDPQDITIAQNQVFFTAWDVQRGRTLWRTDLTPSGTVIIDLPTGADSSMINSMIALDDRLFFTLQTGTDLTPHATLWVSNGKPGESVQLFNSTDGSVVILAPWNGMVFFGDYSTAQLVQPTISLWRSDGTISGTQFLQSFTGIGVHPAVSLRGFQAFLGQLYFIFATYTPIGPISKQSIWRTDGSSAGTQVIMTGDWNTTTILGSRLIFDAGNNFPNGNGCSLHSFDGITGYDTILWQGMPTGQLGAGSCPKVIGVMDHTLFFTLKMDSEELAVWKTDGTLSGTIRVKFLPSIISQSVFIGLSTNVYNHSVIFTFDDGLHGAELWRTNGWDWGTEMLTDLQPVGAPDPLIGPVVGDKLLFVAEDDGVTGRELRTLRFKLENRLYGPVIGR